MIENQFMPFLETVLTPRRLKHSLGAMQVMGELAKVYGLGVEKAQTIGILHDAGKDLPPQIQQQLVKEGNIKICHACEENYLYYLHGPVGAYLVQKELGIKDALVLAAIETHTFYRSSPYFHHPLCWCMRFSDMLEPTRNWENEKLILCCARRLRKLAYSGRWEEGAFLQTGVLIKWFEISNVPVHPNMRRVKAQLGEKLGLDESFLEM